MIRAWLRWCRACVRQAWLEYLLLALSLSGVLLLAAGIVFGVLCQHLLSGAVRAWTLAWLWAPVMRIGMVLHDFGMLAVSGGLLLFVLRRALRPAGSTPVPRWAALAVYLVLAGLAGVVLDLTAFLLEPGGGAGAAAP